VNIHLKEKIKPLLDEPIAKNYKNDSDDAMDAQHLIERYKTRSVLLQHVLQTQSRKYKTLKTRVLLLQDTIRQLVQQRKRIISQQESSTETTARFKQLEQELKHQQEINHELQEKYDTLLIQEIHSREKNRGFLQAVKLVTNELEDDLAKMKGETTNGNGKNESLLPTRLADHGVDGLLPMESNSVMTDDMDTEEWNNIIQKLRQMKERTFSSWSRDRQQLELDLLRLKLKSESQGTTEVKQEANTTPLHIDTSDEMLGTRAFSIPSPTSGWNRHLHIGKHRSAIQGIWRSIQLSFRGIFKMED
jgi:hypothetical protein